VLQILNPLDNGFGFGHTVRMVNDKYYLTNTGQVDAAPPFQQEVVPDSEDESHSMHSAYTLGTQDSLPSGPTGFILQEGLLSTGKMATLRTPHSSASPAAAAAVTKSQAQCKRRAQMHNPGRSASPEAAAAPASSHQRSKGTAKAKRGRRSTSVKAVEATASHQLSGGKAGARGGGGSESVDTVPVSHSQRRSRSRSQAANTVASGSTEDGAVTDSHQRVPAPSSPPVDPKQRFANTASLHLPDLPADPRSGLQQSHSWPDPQTDCQTNCVKPPEAHATPEMPQGRCGDTSLYLCWAMAGLCKHASLSTAVQVGFVCALLQLLSTEWLGTTAVGTSQKAAETCLGADTTAVGGKQQAAQTCAGTSGTALGSHPKAAESLPGVMTAAIVTVVSGHDLKLETSSLPQDICQQQVAQESSALPSQVCLHTTNYPFFALLNAVLLEKNRKENTTPLGNSIKSSLKCNQATLWLCCSVQANCGTSSSLIKYANDLGCHSPNGNYL